MLIGVTFDDAVDAFQHARSWLATDATLPSFERLRTAGRPSDRDCWSARPAKAGPAPRSAGAPARPAFARRRSARRSAMHRQRRKSSVDERRLHPRFQRPVRIGRIIERAFAAFEPCRRADRRRRRAPRRLSAFIGSLRERADRTDALQRSVRRSITPSIRRSNVDLPQPLRPNKAGAARARGRA